MNEAKCVRMVTESTKTNRSAVDKISALEHRMYGAYGVLAAALIGFCVYLYQQNNSVNRDIGVVIGRTESIEAMRTDISDIKTQIGQVNTKADNLIKSMNDWRFATWDTPSPVLDRSFGVDVSLGCSGQRTSPWR